MFTHLEDPAPPVPDPELADAAIAEGQRRSGRRKVLVGGVAVLVLAVASAVAVDARRGDGDPTIFAGGGRAPAFRVIAVLEAADEMGTLRSATDVSQLRALRAAVEDRDAALPRLDADFFLDEVLVSITIPDDACPPDLRGFQRDGTVLTPVFVETAPACDEPLIPKTFVVGLEREPLVPSFTLRLPGDPTYGFDEQRLQVVVPAVAPPGEDSPSGVPLNLVRWDEVTYPLDCADVGWNLWNVVIDHPEEDVEVAVVMVACDAGAGSPPRAIYVYDGAGSATEPHLLQVLWQDGWRTILGGLGAEGGDGGLELVAHGRSYSSRDVPRCCPDGEITRRWTWTQRGYAPVDGAPATVQGTLQLGALDAVPLPGIVVALADDGGVMASVPAGEDGVFTMVLGPGTYRLVAESPSYNQGQATCQQPETLSVSGADIRGVEVNCQG